MRAPVDPCALRAMLQRAALCAEPDVTRPHLSGVGLEVAGDDSGGLLFARASNGHVIAELATLLRGPCVAGEVLVGLGAVEGLVRGLPRARVKKGERAYAEPPWTLTEDAVEYAGTRLEIPATETRFPTYARPSDDGQVWPREDRELGREPFGVASRYLRLVSDVLPNGCELRWGRPLDPVIFAGGDDLLEIDGKVLVMPVRL